MKLSSLLPLVRKPARYIGGEKNSVRKKSAPVSVALVFPDLYEIGMSHSGLKILYEIINNSKDGLAERVFAPWIDLEEKLRESNLQLASLESETNLDEFDIIGFTLPYELTFTNILNILDLAKVPLTSSERNGTFPLIIGGGSSVFNPEPIADFFDLFLLGDGEEAILEIVDVVKKFKNKFQGDKVETQKETLLKMLSGIEGVYIPSWFNVSYEDSGEIKEVTMLQGVQTKRRVVANLDSVTYCTSPVVPLTKTIHDRVSVEVARGCTTGCRFCQAGFTSRPVRERDAQNICDLVDTSLKNTGYSEFSLSSLNTGEYSALIPLSKALNKRYKEDRVSFSLPSLRSGTLNEELLEELKATRKSGITIAPEAGSERLRKCINKFVSEESLLDIINTLFGKGWRSLKLYFMLGLPTENMDDLEETVRLGKEILKIARQVKPKPKKINLSFSTFVPKSHTPFQWVGQDSIDEIFKKQRFLKDKLSGRILQVNTHAAHMSHLEAALSRGDRRAGSVILEAWKMGARFDAWSEVLNFDIWMNAYEKCNLDSTFYANRTIDTDAILPWDHIDSGVTKKYLQNEMKKAVTGEFTPDCRNNSCQDCGACDFKEGGVKPLMRPASKNNPPEIVNSSRSARTTPVRVDYLLSYKKQGNVRFISHIDLLQSVFRAFKLAGLPIEYSNGFNPHMKVSFCPPLPLGMTSECEVLKFVTTGYIDTDYFIKEINMAMPEGLECFDLYEWSGSIADISSVTYRFFSKDKTLDSLSDRLNEKEIFIEKKGKQIDIKPYIGDITGKKYNDGTEFLINVNFINGNATNIMNIINVAFEGEGPSVDEICRQSVVLS